jgi:baculoviral IAP repeat-containing protein 6
MLSTLLVLYASILIMISVCLSLINTWQGAPIEQWQPGSSTLLQVLVSIQSMIFVECPYINEPGREALAGQAASNQHKEFVRANTIRWAMLDWLQDYFKKNGIWKVRFGQRRNGPF